ncbi:LysR family transcriptional regulator (chromosome initiation inhibitor) [Litorimonas taeanensis]|uniref:LysR family transcriptional regulator (Chromosome initiation inhibitor) n=1 Tax=Litorimonas taeanensis TaxID=568099 RepID=A0A420WJB6_9PROT|nr:ArgP/LysG family DNA-binding transcriptional regulator [Litorimonas taeanensis]RKQ71124.1 LysR family transcriptional regulator (chromosome initiation inhibitor) [Litorimonas taeanensis]
MPPLSAIEAVAAVITTGSFEAAAIRLGITSSAVSQRVKSAEDLLGVTLIIRERPCKGTSAGHRLARFMSEVKLLRQDLERDFDIPQNERPTLSIAVNADSLATWFLKALADLDDILFDVSLVSEKRSSDLLRSGKVLCCLGVSGPEISGCEQIELGKFRYTAIANPYFVEKWFPHGVTAQALGTAPSLLFNQDDRLQEEWVQQTIGQYVALPHHTIPSSQGFTDSCLHGLGWAMAPLQSVQGHIQNGALIQLSKTSFIDIPMSWRWSRAATNSLRDLNANVRRFSKKTLLQTDSNGEQ